MNGMTRILEVYVFFFFFMSVLTEGEWVLRKKVKGIQAYVNVKEKSQKSYTYQTIKKCTLKASFHPWKSSTVTHVNTFEKIE